VKYAPTARAQIADLRRHYRRKQRPEAVQGLAAALRAAEQQISANLPGLPAPRPYPELAAPGEAWVQCGRYWIAYTTSHPPVILAVFYDAADMPGRKPA